MYLPTADPPTRHPHNTRTTLVPVCPMILTLQMPTAAGGPPGCKQRRARGWSGIDLPGRNVLVSGPGTQSAVTPSLPPVSGKQTATDVREARVRAQGPGLGSRGFLCGGAGSSQQDRDHGGCLSEGHHVGGKGERRDVEQKVMEP